MKTKEKSAKNPVGKIKTRKTKRIGYLRTDQNIKKISAFNQDTIIDRNKHKLDGKNILVVEDEASHLLLLKSMLGLYNINVIGVTDGYTAVKICQEKTGEIDLVLMDIRIPDMDGFETTKLLKIINKDLPVIAQTACAMAGDKQKCLEAGCDDYIAKPISRLQLVKKLIKYLIV